MQSFLCGIRHKIAKIITNAIKYKQALAPIASKEDSLLKIL